jgi:hypothetical protein
MHTASEHRLKAGKVTLIFRTENRWCQVKLQNGQERYLGAETFSVLRDKLAAALEPVVSKNITGEIDGNSVFWAFNLNEMHTTIYVSVKGDHLIFFLRDEAGVIFTTFKVTFQERDAWRDALRTW